MSECFGENEYYVYSNLYLYVQAIISLCEPININVIICWVAVGIGKTLVLVARGV